jgi:hypothetical protein
MIRHREEQSPQFSYENNEGRCDAAASAQTSQICGDCAFEQIREPTTAVKRRLQQLSFCDREELIYEKSASQIETS